MARVSAGMRRASLIVAPAIAILVFCSIVASYRIEVSVSEKIDSEIKPAGNSHENNFVALDYDIFNSGSTGYRLRIRADIYNLTDASSPQVPVATIWTREMPLWPGERNPLSVRWRADAGNFTLHLRAYRAQEITDMGNVSVSFADLKESESVFAIERARTYDDEIRLRVASSKDAEGVVIYPIGYPLGWIIEEAEAGEIGGGKSRWVSVGYDSALFSERTIAFAIAGNGGDYYTEQQVALKKESGISKYLHMVTDLFF